MNSKKEKKTIVGLIVSIIALLMFTAGMTFAYFTASSSATSSSLQFGTLSVDFTDIENNGNNKIKVAIEEGATHAYVIPGCVLDVSGTIQTISTIDSFARIKPSIEVTKAVGSELDEDDAAEFLLGILIASFENPSDNGNWIRPKHEENSEQVAYGDYLYYVNKIGPNGTASISGVKIRIPANEVGNEWQGASFTVTIDVEVIQAEHLGITLLTTGDNKDQTNVNEIAGATDTNSVSVWEAVESEGITAPPAPTELNVPLNLITNMSFDTPNGQGASDNNAQEMNSLNNINASNSNLMSGNTKVVSVAKKGTVSGALKIPDYVCKPVGGTTWYTTTTAGALANYYDNGQVLKDSVIYDIYKVTVIANSAFSGCYGITSITLPTNSNTLRVIGDGAFSGLDEGNYGALTIPDGVTTIGDSAFWNCHFTSVTIPESVTSIGDEAFTLISEAINFNAINCADLKDSYNGDDCSMFIGFGSNGSGITINIGEKVTRIPANFIHDHYDEQDYYDTFIGAINISSTVLESIGAYAFITDGDSNINVTVPNSTVRDDYAFSSNFHVTQAQE